MVLKVVALGSRAFASVTVFEVVVVAEVELAAPVFATAPVLDCCLLRRREIALLVASEMCMYRFARAT